MVDLAVEEVVGVQDCLLMKYSEQPHRLVIGHKCRRGFDLKHNGPSRVLNDRIPKNKRVN